MTRRIDRNSSTFGRAETRCDIGCQLQCSEVAATCGNPTPSFGSQCYRNPVQVQWCAHNSLLRKISERKVLIPDDQTDFALTCLASHSSAETPELTEPIRVREVVGGRVAVNDDWLVLDQHTTPIIIPPDSLGSGKSGGSAVKPPESLDGGRNPMRLVDRRDPVPLDARDEENNQHCFPARLNSQCFHALTPTSFNIDRPSTPDKFRIRPPPLRLVPALACAIP